MNTALTLLRTRYRGFDKNVNPIYTEESIVKAMKDYAQSVAKQALEDAANNATATHKGRIVINKQSIIDTEIKTP